MTIFPNKVVELLFKRCTEFSLYLHYSSIWLIHFAGKYYWFKIFPVLAAIQKYTP